MGQLSAEVANTQTKPTENSIFWRHVNELGGRQKDVKKTQSLWRMSRPLYDHVDTS